MKDRQFEKADRGEYLDRELIYNRQNNAVIQVHTVFKKKLILYYLINRK